MSIHIDAFLAVKDWRKCGNMIFYRTQNCSGCQMIQETLQEMSVACRSVVVEDKSRLPDELSGQKLPLLVDEGNVIQGSRDILEHLSKLADFQKQWYKYQSDACYCED